MRNGTVMVLVLGLAACSAPSPQEDAGTPAASASATRAGPVAPAAFAQCASCHSVEPGRNGVGPSLAGIYGAKAAAVPGYRFSEPLRQSGLAWDDATLDRWLAAPMAMVPGTRMTYAGMPDRARRKELIDYMKALKQAPHEKGAAPRDRPLS